MKPKRSVITIVAVCLALSGMCMSCKKTSEESSMGVKSQEAAVSNPVLGDDPSEPVFVSDVETGETQGEKSTQESTSDDTSVSSSSASGSSEGTPSESEKTTKSTTVNNVSSDDGKASQKETQSADPKSSEPKEDVKDDPKGEDPYVPVETEEGEIIIDMDSRPSSGSSKSSTDSSDKSDPATASEDKSEPVNGQGEVTTSSGTADSGSDAPSENQNPPTRTQKMYYGDLAGEEDTSI